MQVRTNADGRIVLVDFGIASWKQGYESRGTRAYTYLEVIAVDPATTSSDIDASRRVVG